MSATQYAFDFKVTSALVTYLQNVNPNVVAVKPSNTGDTSVAWVSMGLNDFQEGSLVTVSWTEQYAIQYQATALKVGNTVVTVTNGQDTSLGTQPNSSWNYEPSTGWVSNPANSGVCPTDGACDVTSTLTDPQYYSFAFGEMTSVSGGTSQFKPSGAHTASDNSTITFAPKENVQIFTQDFQSGLALDITSISTAYGFTAKPNATTHLAWNDQSNQFGVVTNLLCESTTITDVIASVTFNPVSETSAVLSPILGSVAFKKAVPGVVAIMVVAGTHLSISKKPGSDIEFNFTYNGPDGVKELSSIIKAGVTAYLSK